MGRDLRTRRGEFVSLPVMATTRKRGAVQMPPPREGWERVISTEESSTDTSMEELSERPLADLFPGDGGWGVPLCLAEYTLERPLGAGGMGEVFAARDRRTGELVALKTLSRASATALYRFKREFRLLADVIHPNLVRLLEMGVGEDGRNFFTMELVAGRPFVEWVRQGTPAGQAPDRARLEAAFRQLHAGVRQLHASNCVHRDLKPSNVLVADDGRVVILDFGLIVEFNMPEGGVTRDGQALGTPAYMAPEQAAGCRAGPPADYYALGVILYQCLTGSLPHCGSAFEVMSRKQHPLEFGDALAGAPASLAQLCAGLLSLKADARPTAAQFDALLNSTPVVSRHVVVGAPAFVGREPLLGALWKHYLQVENEGQAQLVRVWGDSGQGKSALMSQLARRLKASPCLVLSGRCRERDNVPYKGIDAVVDALSVQLRKMSKVERGRLRPRSPNALARLFPVLADLWHSEQPLPSGLDALRGVGWGALRELLWSLAQTRPLAILIDDFQWTDSDSIKLLEEIFVRPDAPRVLLVTAIRGDVWTPADALQSAALFEGATDFGLGPLTWEQSYELIEALMGSLEDGEQARRRAWNYDIATRAMGHPLSIVEMVLERESLSDLDLQGLILRRIEALPDLLQRQLLLVATAGSPVPRTLIFGLLPGSTKDDLDALVRTGLLVETSSARAGCENDELMLDTGYDLIRELVRSRCGRAERAVTASELGLYLLAQGARPRVAEDLFRLVDCLNAGVFELIAADLLELGEIGGGQRAELVALNCEAGERALAMGSFSLVREYYARARALVEPWVAGVREGERSHYEACVTVLFGQARTIQAPETVDAVYEELLAWPLDTRDYGRIAVERIRVLFNREQRDAGLLFGLEALAKLGVDVPARPRPWWTAANFCAGLIAQKRLNPENIAALAPARDACVCAVMDILALLTRLTAFSWAPAWSLGFAGLHAAMFARHGTHELAATGLSFFALYLEASGAHRLARALWRGLGEAEERWPMSSTDRAAYRLHLGVALGPRNSAFSEVGECLARGYEFCRVSGQRRLGIMFASAHVAVQIDAGEQLSTVQATLEGVRTTAGEGGESLGQMLTLAAYQGYCEALVVGLDEVTLPDLAMISSPLQAYFVVVREAWLELLFGNHRQARERLAQVGGSAEWIVLGLWLAPVHALLSYVANADGWEHNSMRERLALRWKMRRWRGILSRWARKCEENYGPMLDLLDGEDAALRGRYERAITAYERAHARALAGGMHWVAGLAMTRLAALATRRRHRLVVEGALAGAREAYRLWGATALVARIDQELRAGEPPPRWTEPC